MHRVALEHVDRETLNDLDQRQQQLIDHLMAQVAELKAQLSQPPKTPGNALVPPSVGFEANRAERRTQKRRWGHDGISRRRM